MRSTDEPAGITDFTDRQVTVGQKFVSTLQSQLQVVARRAGIQMTVEEPFHGTCREIDMLGKVLLADRLVQVAAHQLQSAVKVLRQPVLSWRVACGSGEP